MTAREYLAEIERLRVRIGTLKAELDAVYASINLLPGVSFDGVNVQTTVTDSRVLAAVEKCVDKTRKLAETIEEYEAAKAERIAKIHELDNPQQVAVLCARYIDGLYWWEIVEKLGISRATAYRVHGDALGEMNKLLHKQIETL